MELGGGLIALFRPRIHHRTVPMCCWAIDRATTTWSDIYLLFLCHFFLKIKRKEATVEEIERRAIAAADTMLPLLVVGSSAVETAPTLSLLRISTQLRPIIFSDS